MASVPILTTANVLALTRPNTGSPQYVGIAASSENILDAPYAFACNAGYNTGLTTLSCGEGGDRSKTNWAGLYSDGNVFHTGMLYSKRTVGVSPPLNGALNASVIIDVFMGGSGQTPIVLLTYNRVTGSPGVLTYTLTRNALSEFGTLVINSTTSYDSSTVNYYLIGGAEGM